jgi:hypothetical protein
MFGISREGFSDKPDRLFNSIGLKSLGKVFMTAIAPTVPNRFFTPLARGYARSSSASSICFEAATERLR